MQNSGGGSITDMSWRALLIAASCWTCFIRAALGSEEALREEFRESMVVVMGKRVVGGELSLASRFLACN